MLTLANFLFSLVTKVIFFPLKCFRIFLLYLDVHYGVVQTASPPVTLSHSDPLLFPPNTFGDIYVTFSSTKPTFVS